MVEQVDQLVKEDPRYRPFAARIAGLAFDSAPCYMSLRVGATAIGFGMPWPLRVLTALFFFVSVSVEVVGQRGRVAGGTAGGLRPAGQQGARRAAPSCSSRTLPNSSADRVRCQAVPAPTPVCCLAAAAARRCCL